MALWHCKSIVFGQAFPLRRERNKKALNDYSYAIVKGLNVLCEILNEKFELPL